MQKFLERYDHGLFINGAFTASLKGRYVDLVSPVTGLKWKRIHSATKSEVKQAIKSAEKGFQEWKGIPAQARGHVLQRIGDLLSEKRQALADIMVLEMGKPIQDALSEVDYAAGYFHWYAAEASRVYGYSIPSHKANKQLNVHLQPIGVCAAITPWNFPLAIPARKLAAAWAAGCSVIVKPSPESPISLLALAHLSHEAELPAGVLTVLCGDAEVIGKELIQTDIIRKLTFTGSSEVGRLLYSQCAQTLKRVTLELGGHAPALIFDDADILLAVRELLAAKFRNSGQTCVCPNRIFVQEGIYGAFVQEFIEQVKLLRVGDPRLPETDVSEILHPASQCKVQAHFEDAVAKGAKVLHSEGVKVLGGVRAGMQLMEEETFGPLAGIASFSDDDEGIRRANETEFGLAAYVFTQSMERARRAVQRLNYGVIGLNDGLPSAPHVPFGGMQGSGFGREGGRSGILEYLEEKFVSQAF